MLKTANGRFRLVAWLEGASFLLLLGVAMPLKYLAGMPAAVRVVGMAHGILFVLYVAAVIGAVVSRRWSMARATSALVASVVPFGTFSFDARLRREEEEQASPGDAANPAAEARSRP